MSPKRRGPGGVRPGAGRKPLPPNERLSARLAVSLTEDEAEQLEEAAGDQSVSSFIRQIVVRYLARRRR